MFKRVMCLFLAVAIIVCMPLSVYAEEIDVPVEEETTEEYSYTRSATASISISSKEATCSCYVEGISGKATKINVSLELQKKNGSSWSTVYGKGTTINTRTVSYSYIYNFLSKGTYRTKLIAKVYSGNDYETITTYSSSATY